MSNEGRYVIGLLLGGISDSFSLDLHRGVMQRAEEENVDLVAIPGKYIKRDLPDDVKYEYQYNTMFSMVTEENIDAVIMIADSIGCYAGKDQIDEFIRYYDEIPSVLVASKKPGKSCIGYDNYKGIEEALKYLIEERKCTRFAMMGGPDANNDAIERKECVIQVLSEHGIPFDVEKNYLEGDLSGSSVDQARRLLDLNPDAEAIFCVNDVVALGLYDVMKERGLVPGEDLYVLGYDNSKESGQVRPTLSSIWADAQELGRQAFDMAMSLVRGRKTPTRVLDTMLVKRDSFGADSEYASIGIMDTNQIKAVYNKVFYRLQGARGKEYKAFFKVMKDCVGLCNAKEYSAELHAQILEDFEAMIATGILYYADIELLQLYMEKIYNSISEGESVRKDRREVREGYSAIYRMIVANQEEQIKKAKDINYALDYSLKLVAQDIMQFENGSDQNYAVPLRKLPLLGVHNAVLYLLKDPVVHIEGEDWSIPNKLYQKAILKNGVVNYITTTSQEISIDDIFRNPSLSDNRHSMIMLPLYSNEIIYGYILIESSNQIMADGELIINQLSAAVKMLNVLKTNEDIKLQLEESLVTMRENNIWLDSLSKVDSLTGILNRRGFEEAAESCLKGAIDTGIPVMVMYIDMDNLKIVNDRYGHDEGDFSLKLITKTVKDYIGDKGVFGRIGGDEFACIAWIDETPDEFRTELKGLFDKFNASSDKAYNVTASVGIYQIIDDDNMSLNAALAKADEDLYEQKKKRSKKAIKD